MNTNDIMDILCRNGYTVRIAQNFVENSQIILAKGPIKNDLFDEESRHYMIPEIKEIRYSGPATIIFWEDGTKTVVKQAIDESCYDEEKAFAMAVCKKLFGNSFRKHLNQADEAYKRNHVTDAPKSVEELLYSLENFADRISDKINKK